MALVCELNIGRQRNISRRKAPGAIQTRRQKVVGGTPKSAHSLNNARRILVIEESPAG